jgi:hypothetical protein
LATDDRFRVKNGLQTPKTTYVEGAAPSTPGTGLIEMYAKTDGKIYTLDDAGTEAEVGSGGGGSGINYLADDSTDFNATGVGNWVAYADAAGEDPVDGTAGSPTTTITRTTTTPLRGAGSGLITKDAADRQGEGASVDFTIDEADKGRMLTISFDFDASANFTAGEDSDIRVWIYDKDNTALIPVNTDYIGGASGKFITTFGATDADDYRLILHVATTNASAWTFEFDKVEVGPKDAIVAATITDWQSFTVTSSWVANSTHTGLWRRVGTNMEIKYYTALSGAPTSASLTYNLPPGYTIDTSKLINNGADDYDLTLDRGAGGFDTTGSAYPFVVRYHSATNILRVLEYNQSGSTNVITASVNQASPVTWATGDSIYASASVPIVGWGTEVTIGNGSTFRMSNVLANGTRVASTPTKLGEYRTKHKSATSNDFSAWTDSAPSTAPTAADGMRIYADDYTTAGTSGQANTWQIYIGVNKNWRLEAYELTGKTGELAADYSVVGAEAFGMLTSYDPTLGVLSVSSGTHGATVTSAAYSGRAISDGGVPTDAYFDVIVSENALAVGIENTQWVEKLLTADATATGVMTDLSVSTVVGETYEIGGKLHLTDSGTNLDDIRLVVEVLDGAVVVDHMEWRIQDAGGALDLDIYEAAWNPSIIYQATSTALTFDLTVVTAGYIQGNNTRTESYITVRKIPGAQKVTSF